MSSTLPPAEIGTPLEEVDTPALLIELDAFERNLKKLPDSLDGSCIRIRPHAKTHKCPTIAKLQMDLGAIGVCCQKVGEAEAMVSGGIRDVFISNEIVGQSKLNRLISLAKQAKVSVCADDSIHVKAYGEAASDQGITLDVLIELNVGANRCGVNSIDSVLNLAQQICAIPSLRFAGLHAYHGSAQHLRSPDERQQAIQSAANLVREATAILNNNGIDCDIVTGAGTGTYPLEADSGIYNELQPGSYIFMDVDYARNLDENNQPLRIFEHSLFVYATVISRPVRERAVVDAGHKAVPLDSGMPAVYDMEDVEYVSASDEHGSLTLHDPSRDIKIGDKLMLIPGHCDPTVNLFDWYLGIRNKRVETIWPITARGAMR
ncbi:DSD1 family PLP-dependent enzyme [Thermodesulfobacteriota bacterium]